MAGFDGGGEALAVLAHLSIPDAQLLGRGNEGLVFAYRGDRAVKIYRQASASELERLSAFQSLLARQNLPYRTPEILEIGCLDGTSFTIERRLPGETLDGLFSALSPDEQRLALTNHLLAVEAIGCVELADCPYGHVLPTQDDMRGGSEGSSWGVFLTWQIGRSLEKAGADLTQDVTTLGEKVRELLQLLRHRGTRPGNLSSPSRWQTSCSRS